MHCTVVHICKSKTFAFTAHLCKGVEYILEAAPYNLK